MKGDKPAWGRIAQQAANWKPLPFRAEADVDKDLNPRRKAQQIGTGFFEWPLWRAFPTWPQHLERVAAARGTATA
jgi:hypothetical protein